MPSKSLKKLIKSGKVAAKAVGEVMKSEAGQVAGELGLTAIESLLVEYIQSKNDLTEEQKDNLADRIDDEFDKISIPVTGPKALAFASVVAPMLIGAENPLLGKLVTDIVAAVTGTTTPEELISVAGDLNELIQEMKVSDHQDHKLSGDHHDHSHSHSDGHTHS